MSSPFRVARIVPFLCILCILAGLAGCPEEPEPQSVDLDEDGKPDATDPCVDVDGDGYGRPENDTTGCVLTTGDCDDTNSSIHPDAP